MRNEEATRHEVEHAADGRGLDVVLAQVEIGPDPIANTRTVVQAISKAGSRGAQLIVLPEASLCPFDADPVRAAREHGSDFDAAVTEAAEKASIVAVVGSFEPAGDGRIANVLLARGPGLHADYRKIHLYDAFGFEESRTVVPGDQLSTIEIAGVTVGLATCYDVRFPEQFRALADAGAQVVVLPAAWAGGPGKAEHWDLLTRARALDATVAVLAVDQAPPGGAPREGVMGVGRSAAIAADGTVLASTDSPLPQLVEIRVDVADILDARRRIPVLAHGRAASARLSWCA